MLDKHAQHSNGHVIFTASGPVRMPPIENRGGVKIRTILLILLVIIALATTAAYAGII